MSDGVGLFWGGDADTVASPIVVHHHHHHKWSRPYPSLTYHPPRRHTSTHLHTIVNSWLRIRCIGGIALRGEVWWCAGRRQDKTSGEVRKPSWWWWVCGMHLPAVCVCFCTTPHHKEAHRTADGCLFHTPPHPLETSPILPRHTQTSYPRLPSGSPFFSHLVFSFPFPRAASRGRESQKKKIK